MRKILYLDQNAWIALARGAWDKSTYPTQHAALATIVGRVEDNSIIVPLSFANIYETGKINDPVQRIHLSHVQATVSQGRVFRGRRRIFAETLQAWLAKYLSITRAEPPHDWFLSDLWFEAAADYAPDVYGIKISPEVIESIKGNPARALFTYLAQNDENVRKEAVRRFTSGSKALLLAIEARRALVAGEEFAFRKRAYAARQIVDEVDFILESGRDLGQNWRCVTDLGRSLVLRLADEVPLLRAERELAVRLENESIPIVENDLRDISAFSSIIPLSDVFIGEKPFVNRAIQAKLDKLYNTNILTSVVNISDFL